ncbi:MAG: serine/threonine-protein phosphatase, partial [Spirochaetes bacterium]|nr:serine/threonine-protein phosphatase [Spirochaetota bacterium]
TLALSLSLLTACQPLDDSRSELNGGWSWAAAYAADSVEMAQNYRFEALDPALLADLTSLVPNGEGYLWLRTSFRLPSIDPTLHYSLYLGRITMADQTWLNDSLIGSDGSYPPRLWSAWNVHRNYSVPASLLRDSADNQLLVKVYIGHEGSLAGQPFIAASPVTKRFVWGKTFTSSTVNAGAAILMVVFALYHIVLFLRRRRERESLSFALLSLLGALYLSNFFIGYLPQFRAAPPDFLLFQKIVAGMTIYPIAFLFASFVRDFLGLSERRSVYWLRVAAMVLPLLIILFLPDYRLLKALRGILTLIFLLPLAVYSVVLVISALLKRRQEAIALLVGVSPLFITALLDILLHNLLQFDELPYFIGYGFPLVILSLLFILAGRFATARTEAENLNTNLERLVEERTAQLSSVNDSLSATLVKLEDARKIAEIDMKMAAHVQASFYPQGVPRSSIWECAYEFRPVAGVSGDVFDFYLRQNELHGLGLFDISGHGIAAGLVGMITKSIAANCFSDGHETSLKTVLEQVDQRLVQEKGEVENHATGLLLRFEDTQVEYVNAGHTELLHRGAGGRVNAVNLPDGRDFKGRMLGIENMNSSFSVLKFRVRPGDMIMAYTDCLLESRNAAGEEFGLERLQDAFSRAPDQHCDAVLAWILEELADFVEGQPLRDDLTVIVLKRR